MAAIGTPVLPARPSLGRRFGPTQVAVGSVSLAVYIAAIVVANWAIRRYGFVPVAPGLRAPAGVNFAGLTFVARDLTQQAFGKKAAVAAIVAGASVSALVSPALALASGLSFLVAETADFVVYTPMVERGRVVAAVLVADTVGLAFDTTLFLVLAFHSLHGWVGTAVGGEWMTLLALPAVWAARRTLRPWIAAAG